MAALKVMDLFCGTGGFSKGFENAIGAEYRVMFGLDILEVAAQTFKLNHPKAVVSTQNIRRIKPEQVSTALQLTPGDIDLIIGGPPCQGFSSIRPFRSAEEDDPRNNLFLEFAAFVAHFRPKIFVIENVIGLATYREGETIEAMEQHFHQLGYRSDWRILNAAHFGVPQRRERLFFIGVQNGASITWPTPTHSSDDPTIGHKNRQRMLLPRQPDLFTPTVPTLSPAVTVLDAIGDLPRITSGEESSDYEHSPATDYQRDRRKDCQELSLHYSTRHSPKMLEIIKHSGPNVSYIPKHLITSGFSSCYSRLDGDKPSVTITVNFVHPASNRCIHPICDRALTPREGARLQSFDDDFKFAGNRSQITKQIGNAVPPLLGKIIGESLAPILR